MRSFDITLDVPVQTDYAVMMGSLYQFIPYHRAAVERILSGCSFLIVVEPIANLGGSSTRWVRRLAALLNNPGDGVKEHRFSRDTFARFLREDLGTRIVRLEEWNMETLAVLRGDRPFDPSHR